MPTNDPYRILPRHTANELQALRESIQTNGLLDSVIVDAENNIIDGHARRDICVELGVDWMAGADVRVGLSDAQKRAMAISLNLARRSTAPSAQQRREYAETLLIADSKQSDQCIASIVGIDRSSVNRLRKQLVQSHKLTAALTTIGMDGKTRKVNSDKRTARFIAKNEGEYKRLAPAAYELESAAQLAGGLIRRPHRLPAQLRREKTLAAVVTAKEQPLPGNIEIYHCDFRNLKVEPGTVDLVCTDVVWEATSQGDWSDLARLAKTWLKADGFFATFIGTMHLDKLISAISPHISYAWTFCFNFSGSTRNLVRSVIEGWRPIVVFSKSSNPNLKFVSDMISGHPAEKDYDDWQQPLPVVRELISRLCPVEGLPALVVDPQIGTGTTAIACAQSPGKRFIGCDIDANKVAIAKHRISTEGCGQVAG